MPDVQNKPNNVQKVLTTLLEKLLDSSEHIAEVQRQQTCYCRVQETVGLTCVLVSVQKAHLSSSSALLYSLWRVARQRNMNGTDTEDAQMI